MNNGKKYQSRYYVNHHQVIPKKKKEKNTPLKIIKRIAVFVKEYYIFFTGVPLIMGGLHQVYSLANIGTGYVRFFSITQLLSDGVILILTLIVFLCVLAMVAIFLMGFYKKRYEPPTHVQDSQEHKDFLVVIGHMLFLFFVGRYIFESPFCENVLKIWNGSSIPYYDSLYTELSLLAILILIFGNIMYWPNWSKTRYKLLYYFNSIIVFLLGIMLMLGYFKKLKDIIIPDKLSNYENINCFLNIHDQSKFIPEIIYFNDKYIFLKISENEDEVKIIPFDSLFASDECY